MSNLGSPVLLRHKAKACLEESEMSLALESLSGLQQKHKMLEENLQLTQKLLFSYLSTTRKLAEEIAVLQKNRR